ncbi:MAG: hypothetical protein VR68_10270 [Peptococcaceae bacterium BRH_c4a]|nr:MAG: hypothetical protein VR68_10270 [Peptococcaceae bacterium BRH_c4a]
METINKRLIWAKFVLVFFFILTAARTGYIQMAQGDHYARKALERQTLSVALEEYSRGLVLDRNLLPLSGTYGANRIVVFPEIQENANSAYLAVSRITGADLRVVRDILSVKKPVVLPYRINDGQSRLINDRVERGLLVAPYTLRYGPSPLAVHVVGHLGRIKDLHELEELASINKKSYRLSDWTGRQGLEFFYEKELKGLYPTRLAVVYTDALGKPLPGLPVTVETGLRDPGRSDVVTTIDRDIQALVERVMDRRIKKGAVVVMDRATGDVMAMASRPVYNPNPALTDRLPLAGDERFVNQALSLFQPGSIFKVVVAAAALSEGLVEPGTLFTCNGFKEKPVRCWNEEGHGLETFAEAFAQSCNPAFVKLGQDLGPQAIIRYARALGLENQSILGYPAIPDHRQNLDLVGGKYNLVNSSVGQGPVLATPLQITAMINTVANGGLYLQPRLVREIRPVGGSPGQIMSTDPVRVISPEVARQLGDLMTMVTKQGVGRKAWVPGGGSAGKTGSAQLTEGGGLVNAWFSGYGPIDSPRYTVTVLVREGSSGGETAAPIFREIMEGLP